MNLQQTIADLEEKAASYREAANALRALLQDEESAPEQSSEQEAAPRQSGSGARGRGSRGARARGGTATMDEPGS